MTNKQYQKRILFLKYIKENYFPKAGENLLFYFEDYNISTIRIEVKKKHQGLGEYHGSRYAEEDGSVIFGYDFSNEIILSFRDKYLEIHENISQNCVELNRLIEPVDLAKLKAEISEVIQLLKSQ